MDVTQEVLDAVQALERGALMIRVSARSLRAGAAKTASQELAIALKELAGYLDTILLQIGD